MQTITSAQASPEVPINENFDVLGWAECYGRNPVTTTALVWGYYGGRWGGFAVTTATLTLTNTATNYITVARATGVISVSTVITNWNDRTNHARVYLVVVAGGVVTSFQDHRGGPAGVHGQA